MKQARTPPRLNGVTATMRIMLIGGCCVLLQLAGCAAAPVAPVAAGNYPAATATGGSLVVERLTPVSGQDSAARPAGALVVEVLPRLNLPPAIAVPLDSRAPETVAAPATPAVPASPPPAVIPNPATVKGPAARARVTASPPVKTVAVPAAPPAPPPLALSVLEQRLKDTSAIGVFTKIALKNQVDDLLLQVKAVHEGGRNPISPLRPTFDQLLGKVHALLKSGDPALATAVVNSREAIWSVLADPVQFAKL